VSRALAGSCCDENSELPKCISYSKKSSRFMVRHQEWQATKKSPIYIHIPGGRRHAALGMGLLRRRMYSPREEEGLCHTPVLGNRTEASIRVLRMFKSHV
jgi:hypothetical protein